MTSSLPCKDCFTGALTSDTPTGVERELHGLQTYVSLPPPAMEGGESEPRGIVVMIPDAFGWKARNNRVLCDVYAREGGWKVVLPDFMGGASLPESHMQTMATLTTPSPWSTTLFQKPLLVAKALSDTLPAMYAIRAAVTKPIITSFFTALRQSQSQAQPSLKIGVAAFCWGGQHAIYLAQTELIDCAFTAHPSFVAIPKDLESLKAPVSVCVGDDDKMSAGPRGVVAMKRVLDGVADGRGECVVLKGAKHGFAVRSLVLDEVQNKYAQVAEKQALDWFEKWLL